MFPTNKCSRDLPQGSWHHTGPQCAMPGLGWWSWWGQWRCETWVGHGMVFTSDCSNTFMDSRGRQKIIKTAHDKMLKLRMSKLSNSLHHQREDILTSAISCKSITCCMGNTTPNQIYNFSKWRFLEPSSFNQRFMLDDVHVNGSRESLGGDAPFGSKGSAIGCRVVMGWWCRWGSLSWWVDYLSVFKGLMFNCFCLGQRSRTYSSRSIEAFLHGSGMYVHLNPHNYINMYIIIFV